MNSSLRIEAASGMTPFSRLAAASLNDTSLTFSEKVEKEFSRLWTSGWGIGALVAGGLGGLTSASSTLVASALEMVSNMLFTFSGESRRTRIPLLSMGTTELGVVANF